MAVFILALALRLAFLALFPATNQAEQYDAREFDAVACSVLDGKGFTVNGQPTQTRPPVYPLFIAGIYLITGQHEVPVKAAQGVVSAATAVLAMLIAWQLFANRTVMSITGVCMALYPSFILYSNVKLSETLFTFLLLLNCLLLIRAFTTRRIPDFLWWGLVHGITTLCRSTVILLPLFVLPLILLFPHRRQLLTGVLVFCLVSTAIISTWTLRNYVAFAQFLPVNIASSTLIWYVTRDNIWNGDEIVMANLPDPVKEYPEFAGMTMCAYEPLLAKKVSAYIRQHPVDFARRVVENEVKLWSIPVGKVLLARKAPLVAGIYKAVHILFVVLAFAGLACALKTVWPKTMLAAIYVIYIAVMHAPLLSCPRYRLPFDPFLIIFLSFLLVALTARLREHRGTETAPV